MKDKYKAKKPLEYESTRFINGNLEGKKSEERLKLLFEFAPDAYYLNDTKGNFIDGNKTAEELVGYKRDELIGKNIFKLKLLSPGQIPKAAAILARNVLGKPTGPDEFILNRKDSTKVIVEIRTHPIKVDGQSLVLAIARDITERRRVEAELRRREASLAEAQRIAHLGNWDWDIINNELRWSDEIYRIFGLAPQEFNATYEAFLKSVHPDDREFVKKSVNEALYEKKPYDIDHRIVLPDKTERIVHEQAEIIFDDNGKPIRMKGTVQDITEGKKYEELLQRHAALLDAINKVLQEAISVESEEELGKKCLSLAEKLTESKFGFICEANQAGRFDTIAISNPGWDACKMTRTEALSALKDLEIRGIRGRVVQDGQSMIFNNPASHTDWIGTPEGHPPITSFLGVPLKLENKTIAMVGLANKKEGYDAADQEDIETLSVAFIEALNRKRLEKERLLAMTEAEASKIATEMLENILDAVVKSDLTGRIIRINKAFTELFGYDEEEVIGELPTKFVIERDVSRVQEVIKECIKKNEVRDFECIGLTKGKKEIPLLVGLSLLKDRKGNPTGMLTVIRDITVRKRMEGERNRLFDLSIDMLCIAGFDGYFKQLNPAWSKTLGWTEKELMSKPWIEFVHPEDRQATIAAGEQLLSGKAVFTFENRYRHKDGSYVWISWNSFPMPDEEMIFAVVRDVTDRKRTEKKLKKTMLGLENTNKELESFSYSVSHDLRTPLRAIDGFARILLDEYYDKFNDEGKRLMNIIRENTNKMGQLIDDLLDFSRVGRKEIELSDLDMEDLAKSVIEELKTATDGRKIEFKIESLAPAKGDRAMIRQVFVNLLSNALKYTRPKEYAVIEVGGRAERGENIYYVKDNGVGFDMEYVDKLFGIFQRLHSQDEFEGTGVGLAIIQRIIQKHRGRVWAEGKEEEGATFYFSMPREKMEE